jgi:hypothetical protein
MRSAIGRIGAEAIDEGQHHAIELAAKRMRGIAADFLEERACGGHDLVHQKLVGAIEFQERRQLVADFLADHGHGLGLRHGLMHRAQDVVEQPLMPALLHECAQRSGGERGEIDAISCAVMRRLTGHQPEFSVAAIASNNNRSAKRADPRCACGQPVGDERAESICRSFASTSRSKCTSMNSPSLSAMLLVALDDRGVRNSGLAAF